jgi:hypothetical protein
MNLTGGLAWHALAWRANHAWAPTHQALEAWLLAHAQAIAAQPSLLLIGASAGWMMSSTWLQQFARVDTYDIDPLAAPLFRWRHGAALKAKGVILQCHTQDALSNLQQLLDSHPKACVFFDNVLGQLRFQRPGHEWPQVEKEIQGLQAMLKGREWGSVHDRMSGPVMHKILKHAHLPIKDAADTEQQWLTKLNAQSPWLDHLTQDVLPADDASQINGKVVKADFAWNFSPRYRHWLEAGWVRP